MTLMTTMEPQRKKLAGIAFGGTPGVKTTAIDPTDDLRSKQITPGYDPRLSTAQGQADKASTAVSSWSGYTPFQGVSATDSGTAARLRGSAEAAAGSGFVPATNLSQAQGYLNQAGNAVQGTGGSVAYGGPTAITYGADTTGARGQFADYLKTLTSSPNRSELAAKAFQLQQDQQAPAREQAFRQVGQRAAALGRVGAGMTTNDLTGLEQDYTRQDNLTKRDLALQAAEAELNDRLNVTGALQSGFGALAGQDTTAANFAAESASRKLGADQFNVSTGNDVAFRRADALRGLSGDAASLAGITRRDNEADRSYGLERGRFMSGLADQAFGQERDLRNEARGERSDRTAFETADLNARRGIAGDLADRESQIFDQGRSNRDEYRTERDFQDRSAQQGIDNAFRQRALEETILGNQFGRDQAELDQLNRLGWGYDPSGAYGQASDRYQGQADDAFAGIGSLAGGLGYGSGLGGPSVGATGYPEDIAAGGTIDPVAALGSYTPKVKNPTWYRGGA